VVERYQRIEFILRNTTLQEYETIYIYPKYEEKKLKIDFTLESLRIRFKNNKVYQLLEHYWDESYFGRDYSSWRIEEKQISYDINSKVLFNKHIRLTNSLKYVKPKINKKI